VRIVEYPGPPEPVAALRLSDEPLYRHGSRAGDHLFARVQVGALRPDGGAVLVDVGTQMGAAHQVLELTPGGSLRAVLARGGQGPEEVRQVMSVHVFGGDSVLVEDDGNAKLMVFADSVLARSVSLAGRVDLIRALRVLGMDDTGRPLMTTSSFSSTFTEPWLSGTLARLDTETLAVDTVATYEMASRRDPQGRMNPFQPFGVVTATGGRFAHLRNDLPELTWRGPDGAVEQILRWNPERVSPTGADLEALKVSLGADLVRVNPTMSDADLERFVSERLASLEVPAGAVLPITQTLRGDGEGRVWISEYVPTMGGFDFHPPRYHVIDADGVWLGAVEMPPRFRLLDVAGGRVLGVQLDEMDVENVVVYELSVGPAGG
jgi:hypothetical protein